MTKHLLLAICAAGLSKIATSQTVQYQYYHDLNNNCTLDIGEPTIYNVSGYAMLTYINSSNATAITGNTVGTCPALPITVSSPSLPATNTLVISGFGQSNFTINPLCTSYTNVPYGTIVDLPLQNVQSVNAMNVYIGTSNYNAVAANHNFPVCANIGNDSINFTFSYYNLYTCNNGNAARSYTLFFDGTQMDVLTTTGTAYNYSYVNGVNGIAHLSENYSPAAAYLQLYTTLPTGISALGSHTFEIKSSQIYNNPLSVINYSCIFNSVPCTNISGVFYNDCNSNCIKDAGDGAISQVVQGKLYNASFNLNFFPDANGNFSVFAPAIGTYSLTHFSTGLPYVACSNPTFVVPGGVTTNTFEFGYSSGPYQDPYVYLLRTPGGTANPGQMMGFNVYAANVNLGTCTGSSANSGKLKVVLKPFLTYAATATSPAPTVVTALGGDTLVWLVSNFSTFTYKNFSVTINPTISVNTPYTIEARIYPQTDNNLLNNTCVISHSIGAPYDPNNKLAYSTSMLPDGNIPFGGNKELIYTINFQNVGTAPAVNVKTLDTMDINLDLSTLKVLQSSYRVQTQVDHNSRLVAFMFNGINLPDATSDEPNSHGMVRYSIKLKNGVPANTIIKNRAHNYFDFTEPVATNQTVTKLVVMAGLSEIEKSFGLNIRPNPFNDKLTISATNRLSSIEVFNHLGQQVLISNPDAIEAQLDLANYSAGVYLITIHLNSGETLTKKVIKN